MGQTATHGLLQWGGLSPVHDCDLAGPQRHQRSHVFLQIEVQPVQARLPLAEVQVYPPARVGISKFGLGLQYVLAAEVDRCASGQFTIAIHQHLGAAARCPVGAKGPAGYRQHALRVGVDVLMEMPQGFCADVLRWRVDVIP